MSKKQKGKKSNKNQVQRDGNILAHIRREINLSTRSESAKDKKYTRKSKHKNKEI